MHNILVGIPWIIMAAVGGQVIKKNKTEVAKYSKNTHIMLLKMVTQVIEGLGKCIICDSIKKYLGELRITINLLNYWIAHNKLYTAIKWIKKR